MSRIGKKEIAIPSGVNVDIQGSLVKVKGPKGELSRTFHDLMVVEKNKEELIVKRPDDEKLSRSLHGLTRTLLANMVDGVTKGFSKNLEISGVGYRAAKQGNKLVLNLGFSHPVEFDPPTGIEFDVPAPTRITVRGIDKELVGQVASDIRAKRPPEPYLGKGVRYEGEKIKRKAGKTGKK
ncbi:MAG TPA: 50S ribosomal protein L6 [Firmicutes bacterium]|nr:50S ribosomal protein L6 [Bacillota bacterium]HAW70369.1 50S ribosomal protein L6 [Bacillota bacterium]HAZ21077.1 50S ribosomal protein L6 [Bacillota bacterium]HBE05459.1 50S ribosomal protein L6 [Bacillota bacterium]HBG45124.1 50S ribosomal protein L6 [Bacillota bacterium]